MMKFKKWKKLIVMIMVATMFLQSVVVYADDGTNGMPSVTETAKVQTAANDETAPEASTTDASGETSNETTPGALTDGISDETTPEVTDTPASVTDDIVNAPDAETDDILLETDSVNKLGVSIDSRVAPMAYASGWGSSVVMGTRTPNVRIVFSDGKTNPSAGYAKGNSFTYDTMSGTTVGQPSSYYSAASSYTFDHYSCRDGGGMGTSSVSKPGDWWNPSGTIYMDIYVKEDSTGKIPGTGSGTGAGTGTGSGTNMGHPTFTVNVQKVILGKSGYEMSTTTQVTCNTSSHTSGNCFVNPSYFTPSNFGWTDSDWLGWCKDQTGTYQGQAVGYNKNNYSWQSYTWNFQFTIPTFTGSTTAWDTIYLVYSAPKTAYTISYDVNGGSGSVASTQTESNTDSTKYGNLTNTTPAHPKGYTFLGWSTDRNATTASYSKNQRVGFTGNTTLYAVWDKNITYTHIWYDLANKELYRTTSDSEDALPYKGTVTPTHPSDDNYDYVFKSWEWLGECDTEKHEVWYLPDFTAVPKTVATEERWTVKKVIVGLDEVPNNFSISWVETYAGDPSRVARKTLTRSNAASIEEDEANKTITLTWKVPHYYKNGTNALKHKVKVTENGSVNGYTYTMTPSSTLWKNNNGVLEREIGGAVSGTLTITNEYTPTTTAADYRVEWYDTLGNELKAPETRSDGTVGKTVAASSEDKTIEGYQYQGDTYSNTAKDQRAVASATLAASGTVLKLYFKPKKPTQPDYAALYAMAGTVLQCQDKATHKHEDHLTANGLGTDWPWAVIYSRYEVEEAGNKYQWSMFIDAEEYKNEYYSEHELCVDQPKQVTLTLTWNKDSNKWEGNETPVVIKMHGKKITYIWKDEIKADGTQATLDRQEISNCLGGTPSYSKQEPTKPEDDNYTYKFEKWSGPETDSDGNKIYTAQYTKTLKGTPNLLITKKVNKASVKVGSPLTYTITVENKGTADATEVEVSDTLPVELDAGSIESTPDWNSSKKVDGGKVRYIWELGTIKADETKTVEFTVKTKTAGKIENSASVKCDEVPDPVPTDPENSAKTTIYDLEVKKENDGFNVDQNTGIASVRYTVTVTNNSGFSLYGLDIIDTLTKAEVKDTNNALVDTVEMTLKPVSLQLNGKDTGTLGKASKLEANEAGQQRTWEKVIDRNTEFRTGSTVTLVYDIEIINTGNTGVNVALANKAKGGSWTTEGSGSGTVQKILRRMIMKASTDSDPYDAEDEATSGSSLNTSSAGGYIPVTKSFSLKYDFNDGNNGPGNQTHAITKDGVTSHDFDVAGVESPVVIPENGNKVFKGWSETKNGAVQYAYDSTAKTYSPDTVSVELEAGKNTASKTLYAVWEDPQQTPRTITVKYWAEGADPKKDEPLKTEIIKTIDNKPIVDGDTYKESELADEEDITGPDGKHYVVETKPSDEEKTVAGDVVIDVICTPDTVVDPDNDSNGNKPGDGIPDKYQKTVTYKVENGTWSDGTEDNIEKVFSLKVKGADGNLVDKTDVTLGDSIPEDMIADTANGYDQDNGGWNEKISSSTAVTDDVTYTYKFEAATHTIKVVYKDEGGNVIATEEFPADGSDPIEYGDTYKETDYVKDEITVGDDHYVVETKPSEEEKTVTDDVVIEVTCTPDTIVDPDNDSNGDKPGDGIPDKYQKTVTYKVLNGTWNNGTKDDIEKVFSLKVKDAAGNLVDNADVTLGDSIPEGMIADTANGYDQDNGAWNVEISSSTAVDDDVTYTYTFEAVETKTVLTIKVKGTSATEVYDGSEKTVSGYTLTVKDKDGNEITLPDGLSVTPDTDSCEAKGTEAGTYQMGLSKDNFSLTGTDADKYDVTFEVEDGILIITKDDTLTVGAGKVETTYDGEEHPVTPIVNNPDADVTVEYQRVDEDGNPIGDPIDGEPKDAGTYKALITATLPDGTKVTSEAEVIISKRSLTVTTGSGSKTFDNTPLTNSTATVTVAGGAVKGETIIATATGSQTIVGSSANGYEIDWDALGINPDNYDITENLGTLTVNAATPNTPDPTPPTPPTGGGGTGGGGGGTPDPTPTPAPTPGPAPVVPVPAAGTPVVPAAPAPAAAQTVTPVAATPAPAAPAAEGPAIEALEDEEVPLAAGEGEKEAPELAALDDEEVPLAPGKGGSWALINFALMNLAIFESLMLLIGYFAKTKNDDEERKLKKKGIFRILSIPVAVISLIAFILTEDITLPTAFVDKYTIIMLIIAIVQTVVVALSNKKYEDEEEA